MTRTTNPTPFRLLITAVIVLCLGLLPLQAFAQPADAPDLFSEPELARMLAPIALYPDALLSQILMAATYPIEIVEADRWIASNPGLTGDALDEALLEMDWDPSVKALCHFPSVLALMSERIGETTDLGNAFLAQEAEVMAMVQKLRSEAYAQGHLYTNAQQTVFVQNGAIIIEPYDPTIIYVPYYDPFYVYGSWWYPAYPPYYWGPARANIGFGIHYWPGTFFSFSFGNWCFFDWPRHIIHIDVQRRPRFVRHDHWFVTSDRWHHAPHHRRGVAYRDRETAGKFGRGDRHIDRARHEVRRSPARIEYDRMTGQRDSRSIDTPRDQRRLDRPSPGPDPRERQRTEQVRQIRLRSPERVRDSAGIDGRRQVQNRSERSRQVHERNVPAQQNRISTSQGNWQQKRVEAVRKIQERPRPEPRQPAVAPRPETVRQAPAQTFRSQLDRVLQEQQRALNQQQKRDTDDRKKNFFGSRGHFKYDRQEEGSERAGRGSGRRGRQ